MKLKNLRIENFLTVGPPVDLKLEDVGLILLQGDNRDDTSAISNGAGKSSIGDAICWCLYGVTARGETGDAIINNRIKKDCYVEVVLDVEGEEYLITRYRKHKTGKNSLRVTKFLPAGLKDLTCGTDKLTQELVDKLVGCSYEVFKAAVYAAQDSIPNLPAMTDKFLKQIVEEAAGINRLAAAHEKAKAYLRLCEMKVEALSTAIVAKRSQITNATDHLAKLEDTSVEFENNKITTVKTIEDDLEDLVNRKARVVALIGSIDETHIKAEIEKLGDSLKTELVEYNEAVKTLSMADALVDAISKTLKTNTLLIKVKMDELADIDSQVGKPCPECGKPHTEEDMADLAEHAKKKLKESKDDLLKLKSKLEDAQNDAKNAADALLLFGDTETLINRNQAAIDVFQQELDQLKRFRSDLVLLDSHIDNATKRLDELTTSVSPYDGMILTAKQKLSDLSAEKIQLELDLQECERNEVTAKQAVAVFGPAGVRAHILDTVTPFLNDRTAHYLSVLSDGNINAVWNTLSRTKSGELREKFVIEVDHDKGSSNYGGLSGGEKRKVRLATAMALQDLVASRASKPIGIWIVDEADEALDESGLERLMTLLNEKATEKGTVLVISHNSLSDWISDSLTVIKEGGFSRVEGHLVS